MLTLYACVVAFLVVCAFGGKPTRVAELRVRGLWLIGAALADQILIISVLPAKHPLPLAIAHLASYVAAGWCVALNRRIPGMIAVALGALLNGVVIALNGGTLPASPAALRASGWHPTPGHFSNSASLAHPRLAALGDVFATPPWLPGHDVFSIGDVIIVVGVFWFLWRSCGASLPGVRRRRSDRAAAVERPVRDPAQV
jgi:hypothetical protein